MTNIDRFLEDSSAEGGLHSRLRYLAECYERTFLYVEVGANEGKK